MSMKTTQSDAIVRVDPNPRRKNKSLEDLPTFDPVAWCRLCERAYQQTLLIEQISEQIKRDPDLISWIRAAQNDEIQAPSTTDTDTGQGHSWLPDELVRKLCACLKETPQFEGMSGRSYTSATDRVEEIYKGWIATHQKLIRQIRGKELVQSFTCLRTVGKFDWSLRSLENAKIKSSLQNQGRLKSALQRSE